MCLNCSSTIITVDSLCFKHAWCVSIHVIKLLPQDYEHSYADTHLSHSCMFEGSEVDSPVAFLEQSSPKASTLLVLMIRWQ